MFDELDQLLTSDIVFDATPNTAPLDLHEGERREVAVLFADLKGFTALSERLDPEHVRMILDKLLQLFTLCIKQYGGYIDKYEGDLVMALFGAKVASERDTERAIHAALEMLAKLKQFNALVAKNPLVHDVELGIRIGINTGLVTTGRVGAKREGDFTVYGDAVNLASRMESNAPVGRIMVPEETMRIVQEVFDFEDYGKIDVKGKSEPVAVLLVQGLKAKPLQRWSVKRSIYVGRDNELAMLQEKYAEVAQNIQRAAIHRQDREGKPTVVGIKGPAGIGKSRLLYEFLKQHEELHKHIVHGITPCITQNPYCVFTSMMKGSLNISQIDSPFVVKEKLEAGFQALERDLNDESEVRNLHDMLPFVGFLSGVKYDDVRLHLKGKELQPHLQTAIRYFLEATAATANRAGAPLLVILEDLQWLDEASCTALDVLMKTLNLEEKRKQQYFKHLLFILLYRPEYAVPDTIQRAADFAEVELRPLDQQHAGQLMQSMLGDVGLPDSIKRQVIEKAEGNPFYLEEWVNLISERPQCETMAALPVPATLAALILSRIDCLEQDVKLLLQKAAVIGKEFFASILAEVEKKLLRPEDISVQLEHLEANDFVHRMFGSKSSAYLFKHLITQEVAYNTLLIANRTILHRITAEVIEEQFAENIEEFYYDLAEHYSKADVPQKALEYLQKAGDRAKANYDNAQAVIFYDRLLTMYQEFIAHCSDTLLKKGEVLELTGQWPECGNMYGKALRLAEEIGDPCRMGAARRMLGTFARLQGDYDQAMTHYEKSRDLFQTVGDQAGISKAVGNMGIVHWRKGDYAAAMACYEQDLALCEQLGDQQGISKVVTNMGIVHEDQGDYAAAMTCYEKSLRICEELGDKRGISETVGNMGNVCVLQGDYETARGYYQQQLRICEELGDKQGMSIVAGNLGVVYKGQYDYEAAMASYQTALNLKEELGDQAGMSRVAANMGELHYLQGDYAAAMACYARRLKFCEESGNKQGISIAVGNMGEIYTVQSDYAAALACYDRAIGIDRELGRKYGLAYQLIAKSEALFSLRQLDEARTVNAEGLHIAQEVGGSEKIFQGKLLSAKIDCAQGKKKKAITQLSELLAQTGDPAQRADLQYELAQCGAKYKHHGKEALRLYQELYAKTPRREWQKRIEQLSISVT